MTSRQGHGVGTYNATPASLSIPVVLGAPGLELPDEGADGGIHLRWHFEGEYGLWKPCEFVLDKGIQVLYVTAAEPTGN